MLWKDYDTHDLEENSTNWCFKKDHAIDIDGMAKKIEDLEVVMKFVKQQNPDLDENDIKEMMAWALGNGSSVVAPCSSIATYDLDDDYDEVYIWSI